MNLRGTVSTLPDARGNLFVQMGILRSQVKSEDLEKLEDELPAYSKKQQCKDLRQRQDPDVQVLFYQL